MDKKEKYIKIVPEDAFEIGKPIYEGVCGARKASEERWTKAGDAIESAFKQIPSNHNKKKEATA